MTRPLYCPCRSEEEDPECPACGARVDGTDKHNGVCQSIKDTRPPQWWLDEFRASQSKKPD
ncbi:hypothetical protein M5E06_17590 [Azospirillum sp. A1-3]|uniref:hypothetical protein n=1 Tax=Azospirillum sp. A1-3 TaxID=185874 RepID=UPI002077220D|nr:hypothetical protein [Azospirillum sp. A1-3]MCM8735948.1 hypothetical protein [Azospirillum sp. A1-3]